MNKDYLEILQILMHHFYKYISILQMSPTADYRPFIMLILNNFGVRIFDAPSEDKENEYFCIYTNIVIIYQNR